MDFLDTASGHREVSCSMCLLCRQIKTVPFIFLAVEVEEHSHVLDRPLLTSSAEKTFLQMKVKTLTTVLCHIFMDYFMNVSGAPATADGKMEGRGSQL